MISKEQILKFIDEVGDEGKCIFGNMFWEYFKLAAKEYEGKRITQEQMSELAMIAFHKTTPNMLSDEEVRQIGKVFDKYNVPHIAMNPDGTPIDTACDTVDARKSATGCIIIEDVRHGNIAVELDDEYSCGIMRIELDEHVFQ